MERLVLVLLAAGDSRRFEGNKLLHLFQGKPMYQHVAEEIEALPGELFSKRIVVTQYKEIMECLEAKGYLVVENHETALGISHSVELAVQAAEAGCAFCFAVCDQPYLRAESIEGLVRGWRSSGKGIGCLCCRGEMGNPAIFSSVYREELLALEGDVGGRKVIGRHLEDLYLWEAADGKELEDIDVRPAGTGGMDR